MLENNQYLGDAMEKDRMFCLERLEKVLEGGDENIVTLGIYHPPQGRKRRVWEELGKFERMIWALKNGNAGTVRNVADRLDEVIEQGIVLCVVPSHRAADCNLSGIARVAKRLAANGRMDGVDALIRLKTVEKLSGGGRRELQVHYDSVVYDNTFDFVGKTVLLMDDVTTTGNSLVACRNIILKQSGAGRCVMFAIAQTDTSRYAGWSVVRGGEYWKKLVRQAERDAVFTKPHKIYIAERKRACEEKGAAKSEFYEGKCKRYFDPAEDMFDTFGKYGEMRLRYLINRERQVYWYLVLNGELENHLEWMQGITEAYRDSYFSDFLNVFPAPEIEEFDRWLLHMEYVYEFAESSAVRDAVLMYHGEDECLESDITILKSLNEQKITK